MAIRILTDEDGYQVAYNSVTMRPFGIVHTVKKIDFDGFFYQSPTDFRKDIPFEKFEKEYYKWLKR